MSVLRAACVQLRSSEDIDENLAAARTWILRAADEKAQFISTPENTTLMAPDGGAKMARSFEESRDPTLPVFRDLARETGAWLLIGSLSIKLHESKTANRSFLIDPKGEIAARYDKIHLFDVDLPSGEHYRESNTVNGGDRAVVARTPWGIFGLTVCYDLRFPQLYRSLAHREAVVLTVPSAFTETTGKAHWHTLLRARAIENGAFVIAAAQGGTHANGRKTYGHSMMIGPWGDVLAEADHEPGIVVADLDLDQVTEARQRIPSLRHDRPFKEP